MKAEGGQKGRRRESIVHDRLLGGRKVDGLDGVAGAARREERSLTKLIRTPQRRTR